MICLGKAYKNELSSKKSRSFSSRPSHEPPFFLLRRMLQEPFRLTIWYLRGGPVLLFPRHYTIALVVEDQKFSRAANEHFRLTIRYVKREKHQQKKKTKDLGTF